MSVIAHFVIKEKIDFLGLCEVSQSDIKELSLYCQGKGYEVIDGAEQKGRVKFDCCAIYRTSALTFLSKKAEIGHHKRSSLKTAYHMLFSIAATGEQLHCLLSHWPSVLQMNRGNPLRLEYGGALRGAIKDIWQGDPKALVVLMGDYNDEPFDDPLSFKLQATRDAHLIRGTVANLYNPFWRRIGCIRGYEHSAADLTYAGTYFYRRDATDRWRTYDQIIFSSAFLGSSSWHLNEKSVGIVDFPDYTLQVLSKKSIFDHFPVTATVEHHTP